MFLRQQSWQYAVLLIPPTQFDSATWEVNQRKVIGDIETPYRSVSDDIQSIDPKRFLTTRDWLVLDQRVRVVFEAPVRDWLGG